MTPLRLSLVGCLALILVSCQKQAEPVTEDSGQLGSTSSGSAHATFAITSHYWRSGDRLIVCGLAEYPGKPLQPAFVLLLKLPSTTNRGSSGSVGSDGEKSYWHRQFDTSAKQAPAIKYEIMHQPVGEKFNVGEQAYSLDSGRVFLVDLAARPVQVTQVKEEVKDLVPGGNPGRDELKGAVKKLRAQHKNVKLFWPESR